MMPIDEEKKKEIVRSKLLEEWKAKNAAADEEMARAETGRAMLEGANVLGGALTNIANSRRETPITYANAFKPGDAPRLQTELSSEQKWDGGGLSKLGQSMTDAAKAKKDSAFNDIDRTERLRKADYENQKAGEAEAQASKFRDPDSEESRLKRDYLAKVAPDAAKDPRFQKLTAEQVDRIAPGLFDLYKVNSAEKNADKRLEAQLDAEERRSQRSQDREDKKQKDFNYKRSVAVREELNKNPAFVSARETDLRLAQVDELMKNPNGVNDEAILVMYQKALDPGSVVREGEFARTAQGQALISQIDQWVEAKKSGKRMTNDLRQNVVKAMKSLRDGNRAYLQKALGPYQREIRDYDLDQNIIFQSDMISPEAPPPKAPPGPDGTIKAPPSEEMIPVIPPRGGKPKMIPASQLDAALKAGGKRVE